MNMVNKITIKGFVTISAANQSFEITSGTQITPTPGGGSMGAVLDMWAAADAEEATVDVIIGSTSVGQALVPNYRAEETASGGTASTILDFQGVRINEDQIISDQGIGPSTPISITLRGNAATTGKIHYLVVMEPVYPEGPASA